MFDRILEQAAALGVPPDRARPLLGMLVAQVFNPRRDGPSGFLQRLRGVGLEREVASWLGPGANLPVDAQRLGLALGDEAVAHMAGKLELPRETVLAASAVMLPEALHELSEHGDLPADATGIPERFHGRFGHLGEFMDEFGHWGMAASTAAAATLGASVGVVGDGLAKPVTTTSGPRSDGRSRLLPWIALVFALALAFIFLRYCGHRETLPATPAPATSSAQAVPQRDTA